MNSTTKARLRGLRLRRKPQMDCANTAQRSAGTKYTAAARHCGGPAAMGGAAHGHAIRPGGRRGAPGAADARGATAGSRAQRPAGRARLGLHLVATKMKIGTQFENVLQRGLLEFAWT